MHGSAKHLSVADHTVLDLYRQPVKSVTPRAEAGNDFAEGLAVPECAGIVNRRDFLPTQARNQRVVHLGCVDDHLLSSRAEAGTLLHPALAKVASELVGVDISVSGVQQLSERSPGKYVVGDVETLEAVELPAECDLVIAGEIIEHLTRPGAFLEGLAAYLKKTQARALITTPNAYSWIGFLRFAMGGREPTHPDHVLMFSPATMRRILAVSGLELQALYAHRWDRRVGVVGKLLDVADRVALRRNPWLCVGLVAEVRASTAR